MFGHERAYLRQSRRDIPTVNEEVLRRRTARFCPIPNRQGASAVPKHHGVDDASRRAERQPLCEEGTSPRASSIGLANAG